MRRKVNEMYFKLMGGHNGGSGSAFDPPGYPTLSWSLYGWGSKSMATRWGTDGAKFIGSIKELDDGWVAEDAGPVLRARVRGMFERWEAERGEPSELWVQSVYAHFRNCYSPDGADRNVSSCTIWKTGPRPPAESHLGFLFVREYYPDHQPRADLIANPVTTTGRCVHCDQGVQYESRKDALCVAYRGGRWVYDETCPASESGHEVRS
jgi:hypothetical protein